MSSTPSEESIGKENREVSSCCHSLANRWNRVFSHQLAGRTGVRHWNRLPPRNLRNLGAPQVLLGLGVARGK